MKARSILQNNVFCLLIALRDLLQKPLRCLQVGRGQIPKDRFASGAFQGPIDILPLILLLAGCHGPHSPQCPHLAAETMQSLAGLPAPAGAALRTKSYAFWLSHSVRFIAHPHLDSAPRFHGHRLENGFQICAKLLRGLRVVFEHDRDAAPA